MLSRINVLQLFLHVSKYQYFFSNLNSSCFSLLDMRNLQEQVKKHSVAKNSSDLTLWINCSSGLKIFTKSQPSVSNFKLFSRSLEHFFLTVGQNNIWFILNVYLLQEHIFNLGSTLILFVKSFRAYVYSKWDVYSD